MSGNLITLNFKEDTIYFIFSNMMNFCFVVNCDIVILGIQCYNCFSSHTLHSVHTILYTKYNNLSPFTAGIQLYNFIKLAYEIILLRLQVNILKQGRVCYIALIFN